MGGIYKGGNLAKAKSSEITTRVFLSEEQFLKIRGEEKEDQHFIHANIPQSEMSAIYAKSKSNKSKAWKLSSFIKYLEVNAQNH